MASISSRKSGPYSFDTSTRVTGCGWRHHGGEEAVAGFAVGSKLAHVAQEDGQLHQVVRRAAGGLQRRTQIPEHLLGLGREIVAPDQFAITIERSLAGDENQPARPDVDDLRIAGRCAEFGRIEMPD